MQLMQSFLFISVLLNINKRRTREEFHLICLEISILNPDKIYRRCGISKFMLFPSKIASKNFDCFKKVQLNFIAKCDCLF